MDLARLARIVVGLVLLASGSLKLGSRTWPVDAAALGTPRALARALPWAEIAVGALLVADVGGAWTARAALVLLVSFTVVVATQLARGRRPPCACFGQLSARPIGPATLVRNLVLVALAAVGLA